MCPFNHAMGIFCFCNYSTTELTVAAVVAIPILYILKKIFISPYNMYTVDYHREPTEFEIKFYNYWKWWELLVLIAGKHYFHKFILYLWLYCMIMETHGAFLIFCVLWGSYLAFFYYIARGRKYLRDRHKKTGTRWGKKRNLYHDFRRWYFLDNTFMNVSKTWFFWLFVFVTLFGLAGSRLLINTFLICGYGTYFFVTIEYLSWRVWAVANKRAFCNLQGTYSVFVISGMGSFIILYFIAHKWSFLVY